MDCKWIYARIAARMQGEDRSRSGWLARAGRAWRRAPGGFSRLVGRGRGGPRGCLLFVPGLCPKRRLGLNALHWRCVSTAHRPCGAAAWFWFASWLQRPRFWFASWLQRPRCFSFWVFGSRFGWLLWRLLLEGAVGGWEPRCRRYVAVGGIFSQRGTSPWHLGVVVARLPCDETGVTALRWETQVRFLLAVSPAVTWPRRLPSFPPARYHPSEREGRRPPDLGDPSSSLCVCVCVLRADGTRHADGAR
eukprot:7050017-Prymnesium_polylepis.1